MATRVVEGKKPYTGGKAISIDENKVISLNLRDENNLIIYDEGDDEIYVDLQLDDEITPTSAFPIGVNVGRVIVDNGWDKPGTIISAETTSGDNIKIFYADEGTLWIDNGTGTFKQIYFKADVDALLLALRNYIDGELAKKQNGVSSDTAPEDPAQGDLWYDTINDVLKVYDGSQWNSTGGGSDIEYVTQAEYNALLPGALTDNKHYFIYSTSGGGGWQPGVNTLAYYPLDSVNQLADLSRNGNTLIKNGTVTFTNNYASFSQSGRLDTPITSTPTNQTVIFWMMHESGGGNEQTLIAKWGSYLNNYRWGLYISNSGNLKAQINDSWTNVDTLTYNTWYMVVQTTEGVGTANCNFKVYINGNMTPLVNDTAPLYNDSSTYICMGGRPGAYNFMGRLSGVIIENKARTAQEIADYYNLTKGDYGIS